MPPIPPRDDLLALFRAALSNGRDLIGDAHLLANAGSFPRAYALAILAWEELSKAELCLMPLLLPEVTPEDFWSRFRDHEGKLGRVHAFAAFLQAEPVGPVTEYVKKVMSLSRSTAKQKERGWYVDYRRGKILLPSQIGEIASRRQIKVVRNALAFADAAFSPDSLDEYLAQVNALASGLRNAMLAKPDDLAAALQEAVRGGSQEKLQALVLKHQAQRVEPPASDP